MFDFKTASTIATSIVHSKLDYCNCSVRAMRAFESSNKNSLLVFIYGDLYECWLLPQTDPQVHIIFVVRGINLLFREFGI